MVVKAKLLGLQNLAAFGLHFIVAAPKESAN